MATYEKHLYLKQSAIKWAGKGLFTKVDIPKGERVVEYKGKLVLWKKVKDSDGYNQYLFRLNRKYAIDGEANKKSLGRYANDARGFGKVKGLRNNCEYEVEGLHCYIKSIRKIHRYEEILVPYGKKYWDLMRKINNRKS